MKKIILFIIGFILFTPAANAAYSSAAKNIILQANTQIENIRTISEQNRLQQNTPARGNVRIPSGLTCSQHYMNTFTKRTNAALYPFDTGFYFTFTDVFYQNACLREDIWEMEDTVEKIYNIAQDIADDCSPQTPELLNQLAAIQENLVYDIQLLRTFGNAEDSNGSPLEDSKDKNNQTKKFLFLTETFPDLENAQPQAFQQKLNTQYYSPIYFEYDPNTEPLGCKLDYREDLEERIQNLETTFREIEKNTGNTFTLSEEEKRSIQIRSARQAQQVFQGLFGQIDFTILRINFLADQKIAPALGEKSTAQKIQETQSSLDLGIIEIEGLENVLPNSDFIVRTFEDLIENITTVPNDGSSQQSDVFNEIVVGTQKDLYDSIELDNLFDLTNKEVAEMKSEYILIFSESQNQITTQLEMELSVLNECIQRGFERNEKQLANLGCRVNNLTGKIEKGSPYSLHNFANRLLEFTNQQCKSSLPQCIDLPFR